MTVDELRNHLNDSYYLGMWPTTYSVDKETYINVCNYIFEKASKEPNDQINKINIYIGEHNKILFKNVELIPI